jgi:hypothetical protein
MQCNLQVLGLTKMSIWSAALLALGACSSVEDVGSVEQPFGWQSCSTATADATFSGGFPLIGGGGIPNLPPPEYEHVSPSSYNTCFRGYVVDVNDLADAHTGTASDGTPAHFRLNWLRSPSESGGASSDLSTQTACESAWGSAIFYKKVGSAWSVQGSMLEAYGTWASGHCTAPTISSESVLTLATGNSYRIAGTMRKVYGGSSLRSIKFSQTP